MTNIVTFPQRMNLLEENAIRHRLRRVGYDAMWVKRDDAYWINALHSGHVLFFIAKEALEEVTCTLEIVARTISDPVEHKRALRDWPFVGGA
jgi:hypothetical protein